MTLFSMQKKKSPPHPKPLICFYLPPCFWFILSTTRNGFPGAIQPPHLKVASTKAGPSLSGEASTDGKYVQLLGINVLPFVLFFRIEHMGIFVDVEMLLNL